MQMRRRLLDMSVSNKEPGTGSSSSSTIIPYSVRSMGFLNSANEIDIPDRACDALRGALCQ